MDQGGGGGGAATSSAGATVSSGGGGGSGSSDYHNEFFNTGRVGRRNAMPDILGRHCTTTTADLPDKLSALSTKDNDSVNVDTAATITTITASSLEPSAADAAAAGSSS